GLSGQDKRGHHIYQRKYPSGQVCATTQDVYGYLTSCLKMNVLIVLITFILMEGATWLLHKYIMHGFLWILHRDHHDHSHEGQLARNDFSVVIIAVAVILLIHYGGHAGYDALFDMGVGIA